MSVRLDQLRVRSRIYAGFGLLVALGLALAALGLWQFSATGRQVGSLVTVSDHTANILRASHLLEAMRRAALTYQTKGDPAMIKEFADARARATELVARLAKDDASDARRRAYREVSDGLGPFKAAFDQLVQLSNGGRERTAALTRLGGEFVAAIGRAVALVRAGDDMAASTAVRDAEIAGMATRLASTRLTIYKTEETLTQLRAAAAAGHKAFTDAQAVLQDEAQRTELDQAQKSFEQYTKLTLELGGDRDAGRGDLRQDDRAADAGDAAAARRGRSRARHRARQHQIGDPVAARRRGAVAGDVRRDRPGARSRARLPDRPEHRAAAHRDDRSDAAARRRRQGGRDPGARRQGRARRDGECGRDLQAEHDRGGDPRGRAGRGEREEDPPGTAARCARQGIRGQGRNAGRSAVLGRRRDEGGGRLDDVDRRADPRAVLGGGLGGPAGLGQRAVGGERGRAALLARAPRSAAG